MRVGICLKVPGYSGFPRPLPPDPGIAGYEKCTKMHKFTICVQNIYGVHPGSPFSAVPKIPRLRYTQPWSNAAPEKAVTPLQTRLWRFFFGFSVQRRLCLILKQGGVRCEMGRHLATVMSSAADYNIRKRQKEVTGALGKFVYRYILLVYQCRPTCWWAPRHNIILD